MKNLQKIKYAVLVTCIATNLTAMQTGPSYSIKNTTGTQIRIEGINTNVPTDLYFSDITECNECIGFKGGSAFPNLGLIIKHPDGQQALASTGELPYQDAHIILKQDEAGNYTFEIQKK